MSGFLAGCVFLAGTVFVFFFGEDLWVAFFFSAGLDFAGATGLAFPWAAFFLVLFDLLTV
jgi:hypothetical protein